MRFRIPLVLTRLLALLLLATILSVTTPVFLRPQNAINVVRQASPMIIMAVGMTAVVLTAGIDLSVGAVLTLSSVLAAFVLKTNLPLVVGPVVGLAVGVFCGLLNGLMVSFIGLPPFIATYGMMWVAQGLALVFMKGNIIHDFDPTFRFIGAGSLAGLPMPVVLMLATVGLGSLTLRYTRWGHHVYAVGGNREAARSAGVPIQRTLVLAYALSGLLTAFAGLIYIARLNAAEQGTGDPLLLPTIAAVCIGGTSLFGGRGSVVGTVLGALIMMLLLNAMNLWGISSLWQSFAVGGLIILAVLVDTWFGAPRARR